MVTPFEDNLSPMKSLHADPSGRLSGIVTWLFHLLELLRSEGITKVKPGYREILDVCCVLQAQEVFCTCRLTLVVVKLNNIQSRHAFF